MTDTRRPTYAHPSEQRAYLQGFEHGTDGHGVRATQLALTWPNAYARGYWEGVADRETTDGT